MFYLKSLNEEKLIFEENYVHFEKIKKNNHPSTTTDFASKCETTFNNTNENELSYEKNKTDKFFPILKSSLKKNSNSKFKRIKRVKFSIQNTNKFSKKDINLILLENVN